jgi:hypothetical protein
MSEVWVIDLRGEQGSRGVTGAPTIPTVLATERCKPTSQQASR